jgi:hydrogenase maturation protein HypF
LVLTSANRSSEPIAYRDDDARQRLAEIADAFLIGERPIARRVDDSVVAVRAAKSFMIRRSRGYTPAPVCQLPAGEPVLAVGSDLKNAIALVAGGEVLVSQHIGDLGDLETDTAFEETVRDLLSMYEIRPDQLTIVHDLHPQFHSTRFALEFAARRRVGVQHHHAHIASVLAEHQLLGEQVVGVAFDGTGYGNDGTIWGGEFLVGSLRTGFERCGHLRPVAMPGGDAAAQFPPQAAAGFLAQLSDLPDLTQPPFLMPPRFTAAMSLVAKNVRCFTSTSAGRLFDAVAALLGYTRQTTFEGQAAIWLEHQARQCPFQTAYAYPDFDHRPLLGTIIRDRLAGRSVAEIASSFHGALANGIAAQVGRLCQQKKIHVAALSGGVFQNELLLNAVLHQLQPTGIRVLTNQYVPVNDGGICLGQAALAIMQTPQDKRLA